MEISIGHYQGKEVRLDLEENVNAHTLVTGGTGTGKTNLIMNSLNQMNPDFIGILDYSSSFEGFIGAERHDICKNPALQGFFDCLNMQNASMLADAIQGAFRLGRTQKATLLKGLFEMRKPIIKREISPIEEENIYFQYLRYDKDGVAVKDWALLAFLLDSRLGSKGEELATLFFELVVTLYDKESIPDDKIGVSVITFPEESIGVNAIMVELYLWKLWFEQPRLYKETGRKIVLVLDECQNLNWKKGSIAEKMLSEGRKFGISLILSTQFTDANFPKRVVTSFMQSGVRVIFAPPEPEIKSIAQSLDSTNWKSWLKPLSNLTRGSCVVCAKVNCGGRISRQKLIVKVPRYDEKSENTKKEKD